MPVENPRYDQTSAFFCFSARTRIPLQNKNTRTDDFKKSVLPTKKSATTTAKINTTNGFARENTRLKFEYQPTTRINDGKITNAYTTLLRNFPEMGKIVRRQNNVNPNSNKYSSPVRTRLRDIQDMIIQNSWPLSARPADQTYGVPAIVSAYRALPAPSRRAALAPLVLVSVAGVKVWCTSRPITHQPSTSMPYAGRSSEAPGANRGATPLCDNVAHYESLQRGARCGTTTGSAAPDTSDGCHDNLLVIARRPLQPMPAHPPPLCPDCGANYPDVYGCAPRFDLWSEPAR